MKRFVILFCLLGILFSCNKKESLVTVTVTNSSSFDRQHEMVEIPWDSICQKLLITDNQKIIVLDSGGQQIPYQVITEGTGKNLKLIFLADVEAGKMAMYEIKKGEPQTFAPMVYGRFVPERKDDFAWENNRVAFRIYGPALEATGEISNGMDFWVKRTDSLVIDKWYKNDLAGIASYHEDHGEGLDMYKVGRTLGLGMTAPYVNDTLCLGRNFTEYKILDQGPLRISFQLSYKPYDAGGTLVTETRILSLDAYSYLNQVKNIFTTDSTVSEMELATGIVMVQDAKEETFMDTKNGIMAYKLPEDSVNGTIYTGVINPRGFLSVKVSQGHLLGINKYKPGTDYVYYAGGGWSEFGFDSFEDWIAYLKLYKNRLNEPLKIEIQ
jgi:hypothetical protein